MPYIEDNNITYLETFLTATIIFLHFCMNMMKCQSVVKTNVHNLLVILS